MLRKYGIFVSSILILATSSAIAADFVPNLSSRIETLEDKVNRIQRLPINPTSSNTSAQVEIAAIQEEMRSLRGAVEETRFAIDQLQREIKLNGEDTEYRLKALEEQKNGTNANSAFGDEPSEEVVQPEPDIVKTLEPEAPKIEEPKTPPASSPDGDSVSREHYNFAVGLIREKNFDRARDSFKQFIASYPSHRLVGNAYYWLGETYYVQGNYSSAAESFKMGFESKTDGIKAADNLYKLAKSLLNMNKKNEACIVLAQIQKRYKQRNPEVVGLAYETEKASSCAQ